MLRAALFISTMLSILACAEKDNTSAHKSSVPSPQNTEKGWRIAPKGDLNNFFNCLEAQGVSLVSAHRGGPGAGYPENAIETMAALMDKAPAIMEIDVATSKDGVLYLMHDDTLDRTTTGSGSINALNWNDIKKLRLKDKFGKRTEFTPSRFDDALAWAKGKTILQLDFKHSTSYESVAHEIKRQNTEERVILIAYSVASAAKLHRLMPRAMISLSINSQSEINRAVAAGIPKDRLLAFTGTTNPNPRLFSVLEDNEIEVIFGSLGGRNSIDNQIARNGNEERYADFAEMGIDIIATDRAFAAQRALKNSGKAALSDQCDIQAPRP